MQSTLLSFLGQKEVYPTIFYLKNYNVDFINKIPDKSKFIGKIKWKYSSNDLSIFIDINEYETDLYQFNNYYTTNNISLLKSQLQKAIRRKLTDLSINIAYQMINLSFNDFLRRLAIITLEDVILNVAEVLSAVNATHELFSIEPQNGPGFSTIVASGPLVYQPPVLPQ